MSDDTNWGQDKPTWKFALLMGILFILVILIIVILAFFGKGLAFSVLALSGVLALLGALLVFTTLMNVVGLSDKTQALGLPEGSVRAILALALVGLFAILASWSFQSKLERRDYKGLHSSEIAMLIKNNPGIRDMLQVPEGVPTGTEKDTFEVTYYSPEQQDDFSKQMLTLVGTLMTAVIAFYFGNSTKTTADVSRAAPELLGVAPATLAPTTKDLNLTLTGDNLNSIRKVRLTDVTKGGFEIEAHSVLSNQGQLTCTFSSDPKFNQVGAWDVTVVDDIGRAATKKNGLTFQAQTSQNAPQPPAQAAQPAPTGCVPDTAPKDTPTPVTISGAGLAGVTGVQAVPMAEGAAAVPATSIEPPTDAQINCLFTLPPGQWTLQVQSGDAEAVPVPGQITVAAD